ncbi:GAL4-like transcriptional activator [Madurella fahalii]|uniref:GAL4-like transcriptional activator n=1 Tax=Madurella fahalii TaxID=1157608 RepID=A0ABQ0GLK4_9PEZI
MPRSSFSDNPILRVSRPVSACSRCRSAKVKCDGKLPACTACEKAGRESECSAANDQFARGKERSYVAALELRIEKLEKRLSYARSRKASVAQHDPDVPLAMEPGRKDSLALIRAAIHRKAARTREDADVNSLVSDFGYLSVNATTRDFEPSELNMTFARLVLAASTNDPVPEPKGTSLPAEHDTRAMVQFYETNILPLYPAFSIVSLYSIVDRLYQEVPATLRSSEHWLFWMVLAISSAAQSRNMHDESYLNAIEFVARALPHADRALTPGYATQLQSLLLLTQYSMLDPTHFDSWHLIGFTCRAVIDLGFHQDLPHIQQSDLEPRRRTFYCVYSLDRAISMVHARAFSFYDDAVSVALPSPTNSSNPLSMAGSIGKPSPPDASIPLFKLRQLQSSWYQTLFQSDPNDPLPDPTAYIWQVCFDMREWSDRLPDNMPIRIREMLDLELRYSYVYCIAPSARAPHLTPYGRVLIFEHVISYMNRIYGIASSVVNTAFYTYHDALRVYFMGSQFVAILRDAGDHLLSGSPIPIPLSVPGKAPPPPIPPRLERDGGDNLDRSLRCLDNVRLTLKLYGDRWRDALSLLDSFEAMSADMLENLNARRAMRGAAAGPVPNPPYRTTLAQHPTQPQEVRWMDVDVAQIIRRGGQI